MIQDPVGQLALSPTQKMFDKNHPSTQWSLSIYLDISNKGDRTKCEKGEAWVDIDQFSTENSPISTGSVSLWVYLPKEFEGPTFNPNGIQLFVKSYHPGKNEWGSFLWMLDSSYRTRWQLV